MQNAFSVLLVHLGLVKIGHCAPYVGAYLWLLFSVLNLSSASIAQHPPTQWFSLGILTDTTGRTTTNCCSSQPAPQTLS